MIRKYIKIIENESNIDLTRQIFDFLEKHAKTSGDYDPQFDSPDERFNGPDSKMFYDAALAISNGMKPGKVNSSWGSGCYFPYSDSKAKEWHDRLLKSVSEINI